jgi:hypothetical protein
VVGGQLQGDLPDHRDSREDRLNHLARR